MKLLEYKRETEQEVLARLFSAGSEMEDICLRCSTKELINMFDSGRPVNTYNWHYMFKYTSPKRSWQKQFIKHIQRKNKSTGLKSVRWDSLLLSQYKRKKPWKVEGIIVDSIFSR